MTTIIMLSKQGKNRGKYTTSVSDEDADLQNEFWRISARKYVANRMLGYLHRVIMERVLGRPLEKGEMVDHISGDSLDNRRENLRLATHAENMRNRKAGKNNMAGLKGAYYVKQIGRYRSQIMVNRKNVYLGYFDTAEEAHEAYKKAAAEFHKEFANSGEISA